MHMGSSASRMDGFISNIGLSHLILMSDIPVFNANSANLDQIDLTRFLTADGSLCLAVKGGYSSFDLMLYVMCLYFCT